MPTNAPDTRSNIKSARFTENNESWCEPRDAPENMSIAITKNQMLMTYLFRNMWVAFEGMDDITLSLFGAMQGHRLRALSELLEAA